MSGLVDDQMDEEKPTLREVGKARVIPERFEVEPQAWLEATHHPYAPFTGDTLDWASRVYDDGATYEGLVRDRIPHGKGTFTVGKQGKGIGLLEGEPGDRYEGEFYGGFAHGVGIMTTTRGRVYKGEFTGGLKDGCGMAYDLAPWHERVSKGQDPAEAWNAARQGILDDVALGEWNNDVFLQAPSEGGGFGEERCPLDTVEAVVRETDSVVARTRMFQFKPGGDARFYKSHLNGAPITPMQHPLHYPHGTLFMAPGPAGQTAGVPPDPGLRRLMLREYDNYRMIHDRYNFDIVPASDSIMARAMAWWKEKEAVRRKKAAAKKAAAERELRKRIGAPLEDGEEKTEGVKDDKSGSEKDKAGKGKGKGGRESGRGAGKPPSGSAGAVAQPPAAPAAGASKGEEQDYDEDDLLADAAAVASVLPQRAAASGTLGGQRPPPGTAFGSITLSRRDPQMRVYEFFERIARRAPRLPDLRNQGRPAKR